MFFDFQLTKHHVSHNLGRGVMVLDQPLYSSKPVLANFVLADLEPAFQVINGEFYAHNGTQFFSM